MKKATDTGGLLTEREAAALLRLKPETLRAWRTQARYGGRAPPYIQWRESGPVRYRRADLDAWLESHLVRGARPARLRNLGAARRNAARSNPARRARPAATNVTAPHHEEP